MRVAVASGKGGTGKTTVAVSLALSLVDDGERESETGNAPRPLLLDCDVEAPDAHLFLHPEVERSVAASVPVPRIDQDRCTLCGACVDVCVYNALAVLGGEVRLFPELCHGCGSCLLACPEDAITEVSREVGLLEEGNGAGVRLAQGILNVGEVMAVPVIRQLKDWVPAGPDRVTILDAPPGTSCPVVETVRGSDFVILVTEPTPFGMHDLALAVEVLRELGLPMGVVLNRDSGAHGELEKFCEVERLPILLRIPFERAIAETIARGGTLLDVHPDYAVRLRKMMAFIKDAVTVVPVAVPGPVAGDGRS